MKTYHVKRYTYIFKEGASLQILLKRYMTENFKISSKTAGFKTLELYKKDASYFLIVDADWSLPYSKIMSQLFKETPMFNPLERIYELEQKAIYSPIEGQLKQVVNPKKRFVWTLLLQDDEKLIQEYKDAHAMGKAWPEITQNMKAVGVMDMEIYLSGCQAILIMDTQPDFDLEKIGPKWQQLPREQEWQVYVSKFQRTDPKSAIQEKWKDMELLLKI